MSDTINKAIKEAIEANLSSEVAGNLKDFITKAEENAVVIKELQVDTKTQHDELLVLRTLNNQKNDLERRERECVNREAMLELENKVLIVKTECQNMRVDEIRGLVSTVFQSNRLGYNINLGYNEYDPNTGQSKNTNIDGSLEPQT